MKTIIRKKIIITENSVYSNLLNFLLFQSSKPKFEIDEESNEGCYIPTDGFERIVFANGNFDPDDQFYIYESIWNFFNQTTMLEKNQLLGDFINSEDANELIDDQFENGDFFRTGNMEETRMARSKVFASLQSEICVRNMIPTVISQWIYSKCAKIATNFSVDEKFSQERYNAALENIARIY